VRGAFAHPLVPGSWAVSCGSGVFLTRDSGGEWSALPDSAAKLGEVTWIAFPPDSNDVLYIATQSRGLWAAAVRPGSVELRQIGSRETGLASDSCAAVYVAPWDARWRTLLVVHGDAATGISRSDDLGRHWRVSAKGFHVSRLVFGQPTAWSGFMMAASRVARAGLDGTALQGVWTAPGLGEYWSEVLRDVLVTEAAPSLRDGSVSYWATSDSGLWRLSFGWSYAEPERLSGASFASVGVVPDGQGGELLYAYDPRGSGLVLSSDGMKTVLRANRGLYVGPYVKSLAHVRADASGRRFLAVVNDSLHIARPADEDLEVSVRPSVLAYAAEGYARSSSCIREETAALARRERHDRRAPFRAAESARAIVAASRAAEAAFPVREVLVTARLSRAAGSARVTVDLRPLGGAADSPMFDDGSHGDGAALDGVYATSLRVRPQALVPDERNRDRDVRGRVELRVTAAWGERKVSRVAVILVERLPEGFVFWDEGSLGVEESRGEVSAAVDSSPGAAAEGSSCLRIVSRGGPWQVILGKPRGRFEVATMYALSFRVRTDSRAPGGLSVHLRDDPEQSFPTLTPGVDIVKERLVQGGGLGGEYRTVVVPVQMLLAGSDTFLTNLTACVGFSGDGPPATWWIDDIRFLAEPEPQGRHVAECGGAP